jgi:hypothetical protein
MCQIMPPEFLGDAFRLLISGVRLERPKQIALNVLKCGATTFKCESDSIFLEKS